ncbi:MAG: aminodeoxychorismate lyase, partial [Schaalia hyovaginalis]|nr:aminodeoxychorismate lyase [Schaalia hyovaginalis]
YVTVDLDTGETLFAQTHAEQEANAEKFKAYCAANPGKC